MSEHAPRHPAYGPANTLAVRHGAYSPAVIAAKASEVHETLLEVAPWLDKSQYLPAVNRYLEATAREQLAHAAVASWDGKGRFPTRLLETATAASRLAWMMGDQLGLTPAGQAKLRAIIAVSAGAEIGLNDLLERGHGYIVEAAASKMPASPAVRPLEPLNPSEAMSAPSELSGAEEAACRNVN